MTKPHYREGIRFFEKILDETVTVVKFNQIPNDNWLLYHISRSNELNDFNILFIDEYNITVEKYYEYSDLLSKGDFIYQMGNWQFITQEAFLTAKNDGILIGKANVLKKILYEIF